MKPSDIYSKKIGAIYNIAPFENLGSIFEHGLLSYNYAKRTQHISLADNDIQSFRDNKVVDKDGSTLHDYASCYFNPRNAMLFRLVKNGNCCVVLTISLEVLNLEGTIVTDRNAATQISRFYDSVGGFEHLDFDTIFARYWKDENGNDIGKDVLQAEVLVKGRILPQYFTKVFVPNEATKNDVLALLGDARIPIEIDSDLFFGLL